MDDREQRDCPAERPTMYAVELIWSPQKPLRMIEKTLVKETAPQYFCEFL